MLTHTRAELHVVCCALSKPIDSIKETGEEKYTQLEMQVRRILTADCLQMIKASKVIVYVTT